MYIYIYVLYLLLLMMIRHPPFLTSKRKPIIKAHDDCRDDCRDDCMMSLVPAELPLVAA